MEANNINIKLPYTTQSCENCLYCIECNVTEMTYELQGLFKEAKLVDKKYTHFECRRHPPSYPFRQHGNFNGRWFCIDDPKNGWCGEYLKQNKD